MTDANTQPPEHEQPNHFGIVRCCDYSSVYWRKKLPWMTKILERRYIGTLDDGSRVRAMYVILVPTVTAKNWFGGFTWHG